MGFSWGICVPAECTASDFQDIWGALQTNLSLKINLFFNDHFCDYLDKELDFSPMAIFAM